MDATTSARLAARRIGCSVETYQAEQSAGRRWCTGCRAFVAAQAFLADGHRSDGLANRCRPCQASDRAAKRARQRAAGVTR